MVEHIKVPKTTRKPPEFEHKRVILAIVMIILWVILGIEGAIFDVHFYDLSVYFISLTGFVGAYIISETKRPSVSSSIFKKGHSSKREIIIYSMVVLWLILGSASIIIEIDLLEAAAYFSSLTPYVSTYLIGSAYVPDLPKSTRENILNNSTYSAYGTDYWGNRSGNMNDNQLINNASTKQDEIDP